MRLSEFKNLVPLEEVEVERKVGDKFAISKMVQEIQIKNIEIRPAAITTVFFIEVISNSSTDCDLQIKQARIDDEVQV